MHGSVRAPAAFASAPSPVDQHRRAETLSLQPPPLTVYLGNLCHAERLSSWDVIRRTSNAGIRACVGQHVEMKSLCPSLVNRDPISYMQW